MNNIYQPKKAKIISVSEETADIKLLRISFENNLQKKFDFLPGQFMQIGLPGWGECPISICSTSKDSTKYFELAINSVGQLTRKLNSLVAGDFVWLRGPFGNGFDVEKFNGLPIIAIGGGCGFIPLRSLIIDFMSGTLKAKKMQIFYGCKHENTMLFKKEYPLWNRSSEFAMVLENPSKQWKGERGVVTNLIAKREIDPKSVVVIVGPPVMYKFVIKELLKKKISPKNIYLSLERKMYCGEGVCQHCAIGPYYVCKDGPVFSWDQIKNINGAI